MDDHYSAARFLDCRTHGYIRAAVASPVTALGNPPENARRHLALINKAYEKGAMFLGFPELSLTGYTCADAFYNETLFSSAMESLRWLVNETRMKGIIFTVGVPIVTTGRMFNCAVTVYCGRVQMIAPKMYLANSNELHDARHFASGAHRRIENIKLNIQEEPVAFGENIVLRHPQYPLFCLHTQICQDDWEAIPPSMHAALNNATLLFTAAASPYHVDKPSFRTALSRVRSATGYGAHLYADAGVGESTDEKLFGAHLIISERFQLIAEDRNFSLSEKLIIADLDVYPSARDKFREQSFSQCADFETSTFRQVTAQESASGRDTIPSDSNALGCPDTRVYFQLLRQIEPSPSVPTDLKSRQARAAELFEAKVHSLARKLLTFPKEMRKLVVPVSGGQDSGLALIESVCAMELLGLKRSNVTAVTMPGIGTTTGSLKDKRGSLDDAIALIECFGLSPHVIPIKELCEEAIKAVNYEAREGELITENVQAWMRQYICRMLSCRKVNSPVSGLVINTSNYDENMEGFSTFKGDQTGDVAVNSSIPKPVITCLLEYLACAEPLTWLNNLHLAGLPGFTETLTSILKRKKGAELLPLQNGESPQDSDVYPGPANLRDLFGWHFVRHGASPARLAFLAFHAYSRSNWTGLQFTLKEIKHWLRIFIKLVFSQRYKSIDAPIGMKQFGTSWSAHYSTFWPSDLKPDIFLQEVDALPDEIPDDILRDYFTLAV